MFSTSYSYGGAKAGLSSSTAREVIEGRLPHGMGVFRLTDLPAEWSRQHQMLGLSEQ